MPGITTNPNLGIGLGYDSGIAYGTNKNTAIGRLEKIIDESSEQAA